MSCRVGIIGGGLMGRESAVALARWPALLDETLPKPKLTWVADVNPSILDWYQQFDGVRTSTDYAEMLAAKDVDIVYAAVPHHLHEQVYLDVLRAGHDLLAEKPFGIDLATCRRIVARVERSGRFVRCSSEFPFYPLVQCAYDYARNADLGLIVEGRCAFLHSSDVDPTKPINWKRQVATCGEIGVMGDLGMHVCHLPFRLGMKHKSIHARLQKIYQERSDGKGGMAACDTWDNASVSAEVDWRDQTFPFVFEMKRIAPGEMNTWEFELLGTKGGVRVSTKRPKTLDTFEVVEGRQRWTSEDVGSQSVFPTITGGIFETGFSDAILQMWAGFVAERAGLLGDRFGCATPEEALRSHKLFEAALRNAGMAGRTIRL